MSAVYVFVSVPCFQKPGHPIINTLYFKDLFGILLRVISTY